MAAILEMASEEKLAEEFFTLDQIAHAFRKSPEDMKCEARAVNINGVLWVSRREVESIIVKRDASRQQRIRIRLPKPTRTFRQNENPQKVSQARAPEGDMNLRQYDEEKLKAEVEQLQANNDELEQWLEETGEKLKNEKEEKQGLAQDFALYKESVKTAEERHNRQLEELKATVENLDRKLENERNLRTNAERTLQEIRKEQKDSEHDFTSEVRGRFRKIFTSSPENEKLTALKDEVKALRVTLRTNEALFERELKREVSRSEAESENFRRDINSHVSELQKERKLREDAERHVRELHSEQRQLKDSKDALKESETARKDLTRILSQEKEKARGLEADAHLLQEIRNLLGESRGSLGRKSKAVETASTLRPPTFEEKGCDATEETNEAVSIKTRSGETVIFRPPFELSYEEVELMNLVAGEDEITAEQIKKRTGRKRAVDDLDDLRVRLYDEGLEPIIEHHDVYRFDPKFMEDE